MSKTTVTTEATARATELREGDILLFEPGAPQLTNVTRVAPDYVEVSGYTRDGDDFNERYPYSETGFRVQREVTAEEVEQIRAEVERTARSRKPRALPLGALGAFPEGDVLSNVKAPKGWVEVTEDLDDIPAQSQEEIDAEPIDLLTAEVERLSALHKELRSNIYRCPGYVETVYTSQYAANRVLLAETQRTLAAITAALAALRK